MLKDVHSRYSWRRGTGARQPFIWYRQAWISCVGCQIESCLYTFDSWYWSHQPISPDTHNRNTLITLLRDWMEQESCQTNLRNVTPHINFQLGTWSPWFLAETVNPLSNLTKIGHAINLKMLNSHINPFTYLEGWNYPHSSLILAYKPHQPVGHRPSIRVPNLMRGFSTWGHQERSQSNLLLGNGAWHHLSWSKSICNPETGITRIRAPRRTLPPFEGEHLERPQISRTAPILQEQAPRFSEGW